jgi:hypothetical protein
MISCRSAWPPDIQTGDGACKAAPHPSIGKIELAVAPPDLY